MRIGIGYDVHRFDERRKLKLGGLAIPRASGLAGQSDADVLLHALTDALLGAIGAGDIGDHFPSSHSQLRNKDSRFFVRKAYEKVKKAGWQVGNLDATLITDKPRLKQYKVKLCESLAKLLSVSRSSVSVKAKTTEGFDPKDKGMSAQVIVLLKPIAKKGARR